MTGTVVLHADPEAWLPREIAVGRDPRRARRARARAVRGCCPRGRPQRVLWQAFWDRAEVVPGTPAGPKWGDRCGSFTSAGGRAGRAAAPIGAARRSTGCLAARPADDDRAAARDRLAAASARLRPQPRAIPATPRSPT